MDDELGGYILVPKQGQRMPVEMMHAVLMRLRAEAVLYRARAEDQWTKLPTEEILRHMRASQQPPAFAFILGERWGTVSLETEHKDFLFIHIMIDKQMLDYPEEAYRDDAPWPPQEPTPVQTFVESWLAICEGVEAYAGYVSSFPLHSDETYLNASVLPYIHKGDEATLLAKMIQPNWLVYLGKDLAAQGGEMLVEEERKKQPLYLEGMTVQKTPSGALFVRTHPDARGGLYPDETPGSVNGEP